MKKLLALILIFSSLLGFSQTEQIHQYLPKVFHKSTQVPTAIQGAEAVNLTQVNSLFLAKTGGLNLSNYIKTGVDGQLVKCIGDSAVGPIAAGTNGYNMQMVAGVPAWSGKGSILSASVSATQDCTSTTLIDIPGLSLSLEANSNYYIMFFLDCYVSADTYGSGYGLNLSNTTGATLRGLLSGATTATTNKTVDCSGFNTASSGWLTTASQYGGVQYTGLLVTGTTAPVLTIKQLKTTSGTASVYSRSTLIAIKL